MSASRYSFLVPFCVQSTIESGCMEIYLLSFGPSDLAGFFDWLRNARTRRHLQRQRHWPCLTSSAFLLSINAKQFADVSPSFLVYSHLSIVPPADSPDCIASWSTQAVHWQTCGGNKLHGKNASQAKKYVSLKPMESCKLLHLGLAQALPLFQDGGNSPTENVSHAFGLKLQLRTQSPDW